MKNYELLAIIKPTMDADEVDRVIDKIADMVKNYKGKITATEKIGRKKLAFEIQNFRDGFFVSQHLSIPADKIVELKRQLKLNDNIIRTMFVEASKVTA